MSLTVTTLLKKGASRSIKRNGLILMGILFVLSVLSDFLGASIAQYTPNQQFHYYNHLRGHQALNNRPPVEQLEDSI